MEITAKGTLKLAHKAAQASRKEGAAACRPWSTCTARSGKPRKFVPKDAAAASRLAESAPPLKATTKPVAPAGAWASRAARSRVLSVPERTESAQTRLPRIEQLRHRLIAQIPQGLEYALLDRFRHGLRIAMRAAVRLLQDFVHQPELLEPLRRAAHGFGRNLLFVGALPQDRRAGLRRNDRIHAELQHDQPVADADGESTSRSALADDQAQHRRRKVGHLKQVSRDRLALATLLRADAGISARRIDQRDDRNAESLRHLHQPQCLAIALGFGHAVIAPHSLLGVAALLVADQHHRYALDPRQSADDGQVVAVHAVAVQFVPVGENHGHIVEGIRTLRMTRQLRDLPRT